MGKNIKDYLHLYLGCECMIDGRLKMVLCGFQQNGHNVYKPVVRRVDYLWKTVMVNEVELIKLILRPLSDMTEEEVQDWKKINNATQSPDIKQMAKEFHWMLSKHFDIFGLIEAGLAIDKSTLK